MKKNTRTKNSSSPLKSAGISLAVNAVILFTVLLISSRIIYSTDDPAKMISMGACLSFALSGIISGFICAKIGKEGEHLLSSAVCASFAIILMLIALVANGGHMHLYNFLCYLAYAAAGALGSILGRKKAKKHRFR